MTPCKELDYEVGQVFEVVQQYPLSYQIEVGDLAVLTNISGEFEMLNGKLKGGYQINSNFSSFKRIYSPEVKPEPVPVPSKDVVVVCEGKETTISRSSAEKLNLI